MLQNQRKAKLPLFLYTLVGIILAITLYTLLSFFPWQIDLTSNHEYSLSPQSIKIIQGLNQAIDVYIFSQDDSFQKERLRDFLEGAKRYNKNLRLHFIDPLKNPSLASQFEVHNYNTLILVAKGRKLVISEEEIFQWDKTDEADQVSVFQAEPVFISRLLKLTNPKSHLIKFIKGNGEYLLNDTGLHGLKQFKEILKEENYQVQECNLSFQKLENSDLIVIASPKNNLTQLEIKKIEQFLANGGKALFLLDPTYQSGLEKLLLNYQIKVGNDLLIENQDSYYFDPLAPIPRYLPHPITSTLAMGNLYSVLFYARSVSPIATKTDLKISPLFESSSRSWAETNFRGKAIYDKELDLKGPVCLAVALEQKNATNNTKIVVAGDANFITNQTTEFAGNIQLALNMLAWLTDETNKMDIRAKRENINFIALTPLQARMIQTLALLILPLTVFLIGIRLWLKYRCL